MYSSLIIHLLTKVIRVVLNFALLVIMAALISPSEMAVYAALMTGFVFFAPFLDAGLANVFLKYDEPKLQSALYTINTTIGIAFSALFFIGQPLLELAFGVDIDVVASLLFCIAILLQAMTIQYKSQFLKEKSFLLIGIVETLASATAFFLVVTGSYFHVSVVLLLFRHFVEDLVLFLVFKAKSGSKLDFVVSDAIALPPKMVSYSVGIIKSRVLTSFAKDADRLFYGLVLSSAFFGAIHYLRQIALMFDQILRVAVTTVSFSYAAKMNDELSDNFFEDVFVLMFALVILPVITFLQLAPLIGVFLLNEKWVGYLPLLVPLSVFCLALVLRGWVGTKYIDRKRLDILNKFFVFEILVYGFVFVVAYRLDLDGYQLVSIHAFSALLYWSGIVFLDWLRAERSGNNKTMPTLLIITLAFAIIGHFFSNFIGQNLAEASLIELLVFALLHYGFSIMLLVSLCFCNLVRTPTFAEGTK